MIIRNHTSARLTAVAITALFLTAASSQAILITLENADTFVTAVGGSSTHTLSSFDPMGGSKVVVTVSSEGGGGVRTLNSVTFGGVLMNEIIQKLNGGQSTSIWYLDNPAGTGDIVTQWSGRVNGTGIAALSLAGNLIPGFQGSSFNNNGTSTSINAPLDGTFLVASFVDNGSAATASLPLNQLYGGASIGSASGSAGWQIATTAGTLTPTFSGSTSRPVTVAAIFIPEPSTLALSALSLVALGFARRVRRRT